MRFERGNAGPFDIALGFKPPNGVGLAIDGGGFTGGGFLIFDRAKGEYAGGLELRFEDRIDITAIGILNTRMPDGELRLLAADRHRVRVPADPAAVRVHAAAVGGLLALNRTINRDALEGGVRDGSLDSILFPTDVVANAPRIIGDLKRVFPPQAGRS